MSVISAASPAAGPAGNSSITLARLDPSVTCLVVSWSAYDLVSNDVITCSWASRDSAIMLARLEPALTACATLWCFPEDFSGMRTPCSPGGPGAVSGVNLIPDFLHSRPGIKSKAQTVKG